MGDSVVTSKACRGGRMENGKMEEWTERDAPQTDWSGTLQPHEGGLGA